MKLSPDLEQFVRNPWFQLAAFAVGIFGIVLAVLFYVFSRRYKRVWYVVRSFTLVQRERVTVSQLQVLFSNKPVQALTISKIALWNSGNDVLRHKDFPPMDSLRIAAVDGVDILDASIIQVNSDSSECVIRRKAANSFEMEFEFLDPREGIVVEIAHTGTSSEDVMIEGRIVGGGKVSRRGATPLRKYIGKRTFMPKTRRGTRSLFMFVLLFGAAFMFASPWLPKGDPNNVIFRTVLPLVIAVFYLIGAWSIYRNRPPKGLARFEDDFDAPNAEHIAWKLPVAPSFSSREEEVKWVLEQLRVLAGSARFDASRPEDNVIDLNFGPFWITYEQVRELMALGERHGLKITIRGSGDNPLLPRQMVRRGPPVKPS
jgi:hypothetical protein